MKNRIFYVMAILGITTLTLSSCSKLPQIEIDAANAAIAEAEAAGADLYVHDSYVALQDSMQGVMVNIEAEKSNFIKNYGNAKEELSSVTQFAGEVKQMAEKRKEEMKVEIQNTIAEVKTLIEANRQLIIEAPKGKEGTSALQAIKVEIDAIEASLNETNTLFESGNYPASYDKALAAKEQAASINDELSTVIAKYKANVLGKKS